MFQVSLKNPMITVQRKDKKANSADQHSTPGPIPSISQCWLVQDKGDTQWPNKPNKPNKGRRKKIIGHRMMILSSPLWRLDMEIIPRSIDIPCAHYLYNSYYLPWILRLLDIYL